VAGRGQAGLGREQRAGVAQRGDEVDRDLDPAGLGERREVLDAAGAAADAPRLQDAAPQVIAETRKTDAPLDGLDERDWRRPLKPRSASSTAATRISRTVTARAAARATSGGAGM
jgi:hypothetical protein